ncbi:hypothetical protein QOZ80_2BG0161170 [Eleusine coracana subsp. coracana]|nr:hypothetical protein QOZ80_2BG0161170 [Eleusine coracana subsp. coracana]
MESSSSSAKTVAAAPATMRPRPHVVLVSSPGAGHLIPMSELARRLVAHHGLAATLVTFTDPSSSTTTLLAPLAAAGVATATLPPVPLDDLPADARPETKVLALAARSVPHLRALLQDATSGGATRLAALVPDLFCAATLPLAAELGVPGYLFFPSNLAALAVMRAAVELNDDDVPDGQEELRRLPDPLDLPGGVRLRREDLPEGFRDGDPAVYAEYVGEGRRYRAAAGFLVNTFYEMEPAAAADFNDRARAAGSSFPPAYPVGPFVRSATVSSDDEPGGGEESKSIVIDWLDRQPTGSVVYVSFGSSGALSVEQTAELAAGLESCGHRFLWVVRMPSLDVDGSQSSSTGKKKNDPLTWLPEGFLERTKGRGLAVAAWAPQVRVLAHPATAAFVSHCGWNSTLESVSAGVPMIAWPLYAEQRMNAVFLTEHVGVALRPRAREEDGVVPREEVAAAVRELMEGAEKGRAVRRQAGHMQQAAARAWGPEGSSRRALEEVVGKLKAAAAAAVGGHVAS